MPYWAARLLVRSAPAALLTVKKIHSNNSLAGSFRVLYGKPGDIPLAERQAYDNYDFACEIARDYAKKFPGYDVLVVEVATQYRGHTFVEIAEIAPKPKHEPEVGK